jgi:hypothetical protein
MTAHCLCLERPNTSRGTSTTGRCHLNVAGCPSPDAKRSSARGANRCLNASICETPTPRRHSHQRSTGDGRDDDCTDLETVDRQRDCQEPSALAVSDEAQQLVPRALRQRRLLHELQQQLRRRAVEDAIDELSDHAADDQALRTRRGCWR